MTRKTLQEANELAKRIDHAESMIVALRQQLASRQEHADTQEHPLFSNEFLDKIDEMRLHEAERIRDQSILFFEALGSGGDLAERCGYYEKNSSSS